MEHEIENGKQIKDNTAEDIGPPTSKSGKRNGNTGMNGMSWEANQGHVEVRKHTTEGSTRKTTVQNWKVFFEQGRKKRIGTRCGIPENNNGTLRNKWITWNNVRRKESKRTFLEVKQKWNSYEGRRRREK